MTEYFPSALNCLKFSAQYRAKGDFISERTVFISILNHCIVILPFRNHPTTAED